MNISTANILNTLNRFFRLSSDSDFYKGAEEETEETKEPEKKEVNVKKVLKDKDDHYVKITTTLLKKVLIEDIDEDDKDFLDVVNKFPNIVDFHIKKGLADATPEKRDLIKDDFFSNFTDNFSKYVQGFERTEESKETLGKGFQKLKHALVRVRTNKGQENFLDKLIKAGKFKVRIEGNKTSLNGVVTSPGTFAIPSDKNLEKELNEGRITLDIQTSRVPYKLPGDTEQHLTSPMSLTVGNAYTFKFEGHGKIKGESGHQGYFLVEEKAQALSEQEGKWGSVSTEDLPTFFNFSIRSYLVENIEKMMQEVSETDLNELEKIEFGKGKDLGELLDKKEDPSKGTTPEKAKEEGKKEEGEKASTRERTRRRLGLSEEAWDTFAPKEKDALDNEIDKIISVVSNQFEPATKNTDFKGAEKKLMTTRQFVKKFLTNLYDPAVKKIDVLKGDWVELIKKNADKWVTEDDVLNHIYEKTQVSGSGAAPREILKEIKGDAKLNEMLEAAINKLNEKQIEETNAKKEDIKRENKNIDKQNIYREKNNLSPLEKKYVRKGLPMVHPAVSNIKDAEEINIKSLKEIIQSDPELKKAVYSKRDLAEKLEPKVSGDVFGINTTDYIRQFKDKVQDKIEQVGGKEFPNLMKAYHRTKGYKKEKEKSEEKGMSEKDLKEYAEKTRSDLKKQMEKSKFKKEADDLMTVYSFVIKCSHTLMKSQRN